MKSDSSRPPVVFPHGGSHLQEDRPDPGVVHGVAKVAPDLRVGAATSRPPKAGTQASRHTNGTLHWVIQLISCGLWKYRLIGVQPTIQRAFSRGEL
jgi:hypothetical protein